MTDLPGMTKLVWQRYPSTHVNVNVKKSPILNMMSKKFSFSELPHNKHNKLTNVNCQNNLTNMMNF